MSDDFERDIRRGSEAAGHLKWLEETCFTYLEQSYTDAWKATRDPLKREESWFKLQGLQDIKAHIQTILDRGRLADEQIARMVSRQKREKKYG